AREAFPGVPVIAGGVEASLRRLAHYDYWSDTVRRSILLDSKADLVVYGMGEQAIVEIARRLAAGKTVKDLCDLRGVAYALGARESEELKIDDCRSPIGDAQSAIGNQQSAILLPSYEQVRDEKSAFVEATRLIHLNTNPYNAATLVQYHDRQAVVVNPPALPLTAAEMDAVYDLPYTRRPHPMYKEPIPAHEMIKDSVTIMRGCFGGCTFCSITAHQGRIIQSRSKESIVSEVNKMAANPEFKGVVSDIGGATANMYRMRCTRPEVEAKCKRLSCIHPTICKLLGTDHGPTVDLLKTVREQQGIRKVFVASGIRMDLAQLSPEYVQELAAHHVGGRLKVAPEHTSEKVLGLMKKPSIANFDTFAEEYKAASKAAGRPKQFLVPYFISGHPGSGLAEMIDLAVYLKRTGYRPDQVQDFIPAPFDIATCMWYTGVDPMSGRPVEVARHLKDRKMQRALMQFFKPENWFTVREALVEAGRQDLIGGCEGLIPANPPKEAMEARRRAANRAAQGDDDHYHTVANPAKGEKPGERKGEPPQTGYRPGRKTRRRRPGNNHMGNGGSGPRP
ncbi:MAG: YgiQ family radical SAM protein, partial [Zavarzinella sp.]|nr:YgiQ family radical SAM protein [Zavarzinella sp.]